MRVIRFVPSQVAQRAGGHLHGEQTFRGAEAEDAQSKKRCGVWTIPVSADSRPGAPSISMFFFRRSFIMATVTT